MLKKLILLGFVSTFFTVGALAKEKVEKESRVYLGLCVDNKGMDKGKIKQQIELEKISVENFDREKRENKTDIYDCLVYFVRIKKAIENLDLKEETKKNIIENIAANPFLTRKNFYELNENSCSRVMSPEEAEKVKNALKQEKLKEIKVTEDDFKNAKTELKLILEGVINETSKIASNMKKSASKMSGDDKTRLDQEAENWKIRMNL